MPKNIKQVKKTRAHKALFDVNLPFKARVETSKVSFKRHSKHRKTDLHI
jgi:hypothetical protein